MPRAPEAPALLARMDGAVSFALGRRLTDCPYADAPRAGGWGDGWGTAAVSSFTQFSADSPLFHVEQSGAPRDGAPWLACELAALARLVPSLPHRVSGRLLRRSPDSVRIKAHRCGFQRKEGNTHGRYHHRDAAGGGEQLRRPAAAAG